MSNIRVLMLPHLTRLGSATSGIARVVEGYFRHLGKFGIELVDQDAASYDLKAVHAGMTAGDCDVCHCHGMYWTADYGAPNWEYETNAKVIDAIRHAKEITVPSHWVAETFQRDTHSTPHVIPHGIDWQDWQHTRACEGYVLWNKNRSGDVCDAGPVKLLAEQLPGQKFVSTFTSKGTPSNVRATGTLNPSEMKKLVQSAGVYLATTKETFGIGILEAMASGIPVLGIAHGGALELVEHGVSGYLAQPGLDEDLIAGLVYCLEHREALGANGKELAKQWSWETACQRVAEVYRAALQVEPPTAAVVIPSYNYADRVGSAIESAMRQTYTGLKEIVVVDDGSQDGGETRIAAEKCAKQDARVRYIRQENQGVAVARNTGIAAVDAKYVCCLDADDAIAPAFLEELVPALEADRSLGVAYSGLLLAYSPERIVEGKWPGQCDFERQLEGENQVPTCCVFRKEMWRRLGGYRQRYAPKGCGTEDAEFWLRAGAAGWSMQKVSEKPLFVYAPGGRTGEEDYEAVDYTVWHPWTKDGGHPFASIARPRQHSHPVQQYDEPLVSVVIPVGPGHERYLVDALDSLEAQTFRKWEAIVAWDSKEPYPYTDAYPFVRLVDLSESAPHLPAYARNRAVEIARAPFLDFLDADDWFYPRALQAKLETYALQEQPSAIYCESVGMMIVDEETAAGFRAKGELLEYQNGRAVIQNKVEEYDYELAVQQPYTASPYFWCFVSTLIPTSWHDEIGGFDEEFEGGWEDWDYWLRLARLGKSFAPVFEPLLVYRYFTGKQREFGSQIKDRLFDYMRKKFEEIEIVPCRGCGRGQARQSTVQHLDRRRPVTNEKGSNPEFVKCKFTPPWTGDRLVIGQTVFEQRIGDYVMIKVNRPGRRGYSFSYGYRTPGEMFYVHRSDVERTPGWFEPVTRTAPASAILLPIPAVAPLPPPVRAATTPAAPPVIEGFAAPLDAVLPPLAEGEKADPVPGESIEPASRREFDPQLLPGVTSNVAGQMRAAGIESLDDVLALGVEGLEEFSGVGEVKARLILDSVGELKRQMETAQEVSSNIPRNMTDRE